MELLGIDPAILISPAALLGIVFLGFMLGIFFPRAAVTRLWKQLDAREAENKELRDTLDTQADSMEKLANQVGDVKTALQGVLYAMQEIQAAGRYAAGMEPAPRTLMQKTRDEEA